MSTQQVIALYVLGLIFIFVSILYLDRRSKVNRIVKKVKLKLYLSCYSIQKTDKNTLTAVKGILGISDDNNIVFGTSYNNSIMFDAYDISKIVDFQNATYKDTQFAYIGENITFNILNIMGVDRRNVIPKFIKEMSFWILKYSAYEEVNHVFFAYKNNIKNAKCINSINALLKRSM